MPTHLDNQTATRVLLIEDDEDIRAMLGEFLSREGYEVRGAGNGKLASMELAAFRPDLLILDLMLPGEDGLSVCRRIRAESDVPIIMLTARHDDTDRIVGLEVGADDYVGKPFNPRELLARIRALLRRAQPRARIDTERPRRLRIGEVVIDIDARTVTNAMGVPIELTTAEFDLLVCFAERPRRVLSRDQLLDWTRGRQADPFDRTIDVTVSRLRTKLARSAPEIGAAITTVRNGGYLFSLPVSGA